MNPHQKNKVDVSSLSPEEQRLFRLYGKLPTQKDMLTNKLKDRKYFDSGDYALQKAGKTTDSGVNAATGREHPSPDTIPHLSSSPSGSGGGGAEPRASFSGASGASGPGGLPTLSTFAAGGGGFGGGAGSSGSPVKESSFLHRGQSVDDIPDEEAQA